eukprot:CAMPEP_0169085216 /NCGR_PEP_ID=MMETSP1015-20121227/13037_1 /TAXON_ID=342587 /ORGANISM="Karlodinium micrum, Strain CCMP2283" /LENGTH=478 /DNA_ID=CAMNT_0009145279 /DNA_START=36 /DNA_END=1472 /DNA_ORIENTATION=-
MAFQKCAEGSISIAIVGSGISGLGLAGVLSKNLGHRVAISIFERSTPDHDQGYGLDLDEHGQEALARAGVYDRYWEISRPRSDVMKFYTLRGDCPVAIFFRPKLLQAIFPSFFGAQPESNRNGIRQILLDKMQERGNTSIQYACAASRVAAVARNGVNKAELFEENGTSLGEFDLVVDAAGVHSRLRSFRMEDKQGKHITGLMIHGVINDPEATAPQALLDRLGQGSLMVMGRGYTSCLQRFGADPEDHRTAFFYIMNHRADEDGLVKEIGLTKTTSRKEGIRTDAESLAKVKAFLHADMADHFEPLYHNAVDCLNRVTVRGIYSHGDSRLSDDCSLPLICIGDAQRNIGLGGGGNLALQDSMDVARFLSSESAFDSADGSLNLQALREIESHMLKRKVEFHEERRKRMEGLLGSRQDNPEKSSISITDLAGGNRVIASMMSVFSGILRLAHSWERWWGILGSVPGSRMFSSVRKVLD